jgi:hypothetical protein
MRVSITNEAGDLINLNVSPDTAVSDLSGLITAEFKITGATNVQVYFNGDLLSTGTLKDAKVANDDILLVKYQIQQAQAASNPNQPANQAELIRQQILQNPQLRQQVISQNPMMATALNDPVQFQRIFAEMQRHMAQQPQSAAGQYDEMDPEGQRRIEEEIRQRNIATNMEVTKDNVDCYGIPS